MERGAGLGLAVDLNTSFQELPVVGRSCEVAGDGKKLIAKGVGTVALKPRMETAAGSWRDDSVAKVVLLSERSGSIPSMHMGSSYPPGAPALGSIAGSCAYVHTPLTEHMHMCHLKKKSSREILVRNQ